MSSGNMNYLPIVSVLGAVRVLAEDGQDRGLVSFGTSGSGSIVPAESASPVYSGRSHVGIRLGGNRVVTLTFSYFTTPGRPDSENEADRVAWYFFAGSDDRVGVQRAVHTRPLDVMPPGLPRPRRMRAWFLTGLTD
jgi:hypothetical protein